MTPISKLTIEGIPTQVINFTKAYSHLAGLDEEQFWRREVAGIVDGLLQILTEHNLDQIRKYWSLDEAIADLKIQ